MGINKYELKQVNLNVFFIKNKRFSDTDETKLSAINIVILSKFSSGKTTFPLVIKFIST